MSFRSRGELPALLILPSLGILAVVGAVLLGWSPRPLRFAEVYGGPTDTDLPLHVRVQVREEWAGVERAVSELPVRVRWRGASSEREVEGQTDAEGWVELSLERPEPAAPVQLEVKEAGTGQILARGAPVLPLARWRAAALERSAVLRWQTENPWGIRGIIEESVLAVPFTGHLRLEWEQPAAQEGPLQVSVEGEGVEIVGQQSAVWHPQEPWRVGLRPTEHNAALTVRLMSAAGEPGELRARLPVVPGAFYLEKRGTGALLSSPLPRERLWYTFVSPAGRLSGGRLALQEGPHGIFSGELTAEQIPAGAERYLILASSPDGRSPSTVGFPWEGQTNSWTALDGHLLDGGPEVRRREAARRARLQTGVFLYVACIAGLTLFLFLHRLRREQRKLDQALDVWAEAGAARSELAQVQSSSGWLLGILCLVLGFSLALLWIASSGGIF